MKKNRCVGCGLSKKEGDNPCTLHLEKSRNEMIEMFNEMLEYYRYDKIDETKKSTTEIFLDKVKDFTTKHFLELLEVMLEGRIKRIEKILAKVIYNLTSRLEHDKDEILEFLDEMEY